MEDIEEVLGEEYKEYKKNANNLKLLVKKLKKVPLLNKLTDNELIKISNYIKLKNMFKDKK